MARLPKPLEEQLIATKEELKRIQDKEERLKEKIADIEAQIEDKNMRESYALLKEHGISLEILEEMLSSIVLKELKEAS